MFNFSGSEIVFLLLLALIILGPEKLPEAVRKFAKTYGEFKKVTTGFQSELKQVLDEPMREMRETADAFKKAATLDIDTSAFTDPFGKAVSSADQRSVTAEEQTASADDAAAAASNAEPGPAPVPSASASVGNEPPLASSQPTSSDPAAAASSVDDGPPPAAAAPDEPTDGAAPA